MSSRIGWSDLPEELIDLIADRSSNIDLLRIRSICKPWRSAVAHIHRHVYFIEPLSEIVPTKKRFRDRFQRKFMTKNYLINHNKFFRVTHASSSSCQNKVWLIKTKPVYKSSKINLLCPLSGKLINITSSDKTLDLMQFGVSEIHQSYNSGKNRVVLLENMFFRLGNNKRIWFCNSVEENTRWRCIENERVEDFSDIIVHKRNIYALDINGLIWWISLSKLNFIQYTPPIPNDYDDYNNGTTYKDRRLVEYCGDLCIVHRFYKRFKRSVIVRTISFKVYKMDETLAEWVEVSSLEDKAMIVAKDSCFMVLASEYGCLGNAIYFIDDMISDDEEEGEDIVRVFKLDDGSITEMVDSSSHSCFHMFSPLPFSET